MGWNCMGSTNNDYMARGQLLMVYNAIADVTLLNTGLTSIANTIRSKGGTATSLAFPSAFISAISAFEDPISYIEGTITSSQNATLSNIPDYAFTGCSLLSSISFPACTTIGTYAFLGCETLTTLSFSQCTTIGSYAFGSCKNVSMISFPVCTSIEYGAFYICGSINTAYFPVCSIIGSYGFYGVNNISSMSFPVCTIIS